MAYRDVILADAPVAYYRLGEASGTTAVSETATHPGTYVNGPLLGQPGVLAGDANTAVSFDGVNDKVSVPSNAAFNLQAGRTVEAWVRADVLTRKQSLVARSSSGGPYHWGLSILADGRFEWFVGSSGAGAFGTLVTGAASGAVQHVVGTHDGATMRLYVNGVQVGTLATSITPGTGAQVVTLGAEGDQNFFDGLLDEVAIYNYALTAAKVAEHYQAGTTAPATAPADTTPPAIPTGLAATPGNAQVALSWTANAESDLAGYRLYRGGVQVYDGAAATFTDATVANGTTYSYTVSAYDTAGNESAKSTAVQATPATPPPSADTTPPAVPTGLTAAPGDAQVSLDWSDNTEADLAGYRLYRDSVQIFDGVASAYLDATAVNGTTHSYAVSAYDATGNQSAQSVAVQATPAAAPPPADTTPTPDPTPVVAPTPSPRRRYAAGGLLSALSMDTPDGPVTLLAPGSRGVHNAEGFAGMATRVITTARAGRHGSVNRTRHREDRQITWEGTLQSTDNNPDRAWWEYQQIARALASAQDEDRELHYTLGQGLPLFARVRLEELSAPIEVGPNIIKYQATMRAQDPRGYSVVEHVEQTGPLFREDLPVGSAVFPLKFPFTFATLTTGALEVHNAGTVPTPPTIELDGYLLNPVVELGDRRLVFVGTIAEGDTLTIDTDKRSVVLNGTANRRGLLNSPASRWFELPPYPAVIELLPQAFSGAGGLRVRFRDAIQ